MTELARVGAVGRSTPEHPSRRAWLWVAAYSAVISVIAIAAFSSRAAAPIMTSRSDDLAAAIAVLDRGGPPLLASNVPYHDGIDAGHLRPVGVTDDQGIYLYLPFLAKITGEHDPSTLMKWLFMGCFGLLILVLPLLFYELFGSVTVAVVTPLLALWKFAFTQTLDLYWILAWCMLLGIPALLVAYHWWSAGLRRRAVLLLVALMLAASFATSIRIHAGLPLLIGAVGLALFAGTAPWRERRALVRFWRLPRWWFRPAVAIVLVLAYLSIATFGFAAVRAYRNHVIHQPSFGSAWPTEHPFWHNAYIGLGYLPNQYGIEWSDNVAADAVARDRPGTGFLTKEYEATLRHRYAELIRDDPGFVLDNLWTKSRVIVGEAVSRFWPALIILPLAAVVGSRRRSIRIALLLAVPAALVGALSPVLTVPETKYQLAWLGTWGALFLIAIGWLWTSVAALLQREVPSELEPLRRRPDPTALEALRARLVGMRGTWILGAACALTLLLAAVARPTPPPSSFSLYNSNPPTFAERSELDRHGIENWRFDGALPAGWSTVSPAFLQADNSETDEVGLYTRSTMTTSEDDLMSPVVKLPAGTYDVLASGKALVGGFRIGVREENGQELASEGFSTLTTDYLSKALLVRFTLGAPSRVRVFASAWSEFPNASAWVLWKMTLVRSR